MVHTESETQGGKFPGEGEEGRDFPGEEDDIPWEENAFWNDLYQWRGGTDWKLDDLHSRLSEMEQRPPIPFEVIVDEKLSIFESDVLRKNLELQSEMEGHVLGRLQEEGQKIISNARAAVNEFLQRCQEEGLALKAMANGQKELINIEMGRLLEGRLREFESGVKTQLESGIKAVGGRCKL